MRYSLVKILFPTLLFAWSISATAQTTIEQEEEDNWIDKIKTKVAPYASLRIGVGFAEKGEIGVSNNLPRGGLKVKHALSKKAADNLNVIGQVEFGFNLTLRDETVEFAVDEGAGVTQVGDAVFTRIGFLGFTYKDLQLTFGKQNSVYFTMGAAPVFKFSAFGGSAIGVWNISDGGVSGTGRANQAIILSYKKNGLSVGVQAGGRNISINSQPIDAFGLAANYKVAGFTIGVGYNKVNDGVEVPLPNQAKNGDAAFVTSVAYEKNRFMVAAAYSILKQHQRTRKNGASFFYDANGVEFIIRYKFSKNKKWHAAAGFNTLTPDDNQGLGNFDTKFGILEMAYNFKPSSNVFVAAKIDQSENATGDNRSQSVYGLGIRLDF